MGHVRAKGELIDRDKGYRRIVAELKRAEGDAYVKVGVLGDAGYEGDGVSVVELAAIHEFGAPRAGIPERSFVRRTFDRKREEWWTLTKRLCGLVYGGTMTISRALGLLGAKAAADVKATVTQGAEIPPPPAPSTLRRKLGKSSGAVGEPRNLVDTGRMVGSITWAVVVGKAGEGEGGHEG